MEIHEPHQSTSLLEANWDHMIYYRLPESDFKREIGIKVDKAKQYKIPRGSFPCIPTNDQQVGPCMDRLVLNYLNCSLPWVNHVSAGYMKCETQEQLDPYYDLLERILEDPEYDEFDYKLYKIVKTRIWETKIMYDDIYDTDNKNTPLQITLYSLSRKVSVIVSKVIL